MFEILNFPHTIEYAGTAILFACMFFLCSLKPIAILQQGGYRNRRMLGWYRKKSNLLVWRYAMLATMLLMGVLVFGVVFTFAGEEIAFRITVFVFVLFCLLFFVAERRFALKVPVNETERIKRLALTLFFVLTVGLYILIVLCNVVAYYAGNRLVAVWRYLPLCFIPLLLPYFACVANGLDGIFERAHNKKYIRRATEKLQNTSAVRIGITGSFGKTSVKNILAGMLAEKYAVFATPASYNTPMGIARCVNERKEEYEIFIAEMGARQQGDIAELCDIVAPDHAIVTGVCNQHLETFGTVEAVLAEKSVLPDRIPQNGFAVIGRDDYTSTLHIEGKKVLFVGKEQIADLQLSADGVQFTLRLDGRDIPIKSKLLGEHSARNIALAATMAYALGVGAEEIARAAAKTEYVPHRLEKSVRGDITILDDSYNANVAGAQEALRVLSLFAGRKIVITPGLVELGVMEEAENEKFGRSLTVADLVILVGDTQVCAVKSGYLAAGGKAENVVVCPTLEKAKEALSECLRAGDTVLFLNDLPDIY